MIPEAHPLPNGLVIMFEGIDGTGKTTQLNLAQEALTKAGWQVLSTRNLGGTPIGEALRDVLLSKLERPALTDFYTSLAIQEPLLDLIDKARQDGKIILMDRGPLSLAAYQIYGAGIDAAMASPHVEAGMSRIRPEATILYDTDVRTAMDRKRQGAEPDYFESKSPDYFQKVADGYRESIAKYPAAVIDAGQSIGDIQEQTLAVITKTLQNQT